MPNTYQNILVAIDGSEQSEKAFQEALAVAKKNHADLYITSFIDEDDFISSVRSFDKLLQTEENKVNAEVQEKVQVANEIDNMHAITKIGNPKKLIVDSAKNHKIDLIIIGATGKGAIKRALVGSTTAYVVNHAPCNVLVVR